jgi:PKD repeat protein
MNKCLFLFLMLVISTRITICEEVTVYSKSTLTAFEMNSGDAVNYVLRSGRTVHIELLHSESQIVFTTLDSLKKGGTGHGSIFAISCELRIDGQEMSMVRYVPVQETFYEPYVVNGLKIWFDALKSLSSLFNENHGACLPQKEASFVFQDADLTICPQKIGNWVSLPDKKVLVKNAYRGNDTWLGTYHGADLHGGLDINMPSNTTLYAPIDFDEHYYFNSLIAGHNNNRWRGVRNWDNGDVWHLQTHHLVQLLCPEHQPLQKGQPYAYTAGVLSGYSAHTHFVFRIKQPNSNWLYIDPWILFYQIFENNKQKEKSIYANIAPLKSAKTGQRVQFKSSDSRPGIWGNELEYYWNFGDGYTSFSKNPVHIFTKPGIYPVTLLLRDGTDQDVCTQHTTVNGPTLSSKEFQITGKDEPSFFKRKNWKTRQHGLSGEITNTLVFKAYFRQKEALDAKELLVTFNDLEWKKKDDRNYRIEPVYKHGQDWLDLKVEHFEDSLKIIVQPRLENMVIQHGFYEAFLLVNHNQAINSPQLMRVLVQFDASPPSSTTIVDDQDVNCIYSDYFWLSPEYPYNWSKGHNGAYMLNKDNQPGEYVRYTPNLIQGTYSVELFGKAFENKKLLSKTKGFYVTVKHNGLIERVWIEPATSLQIGVFDFSKGKQGYVEIISDDSKGLIIADAVKFEKIN